MTTLLAKGIAPCARTAATVNTAGGTIAARAARAMAFVSGVAMPRATARPTARAIMPKAMNMAITTALMLTMAAAPRTAAAAAPAPPPAAATAIVGGTVVALGGGDPVEDAVVLIEGERIAAIGARGSVDIPDGAEIVDASGRWLLPGLMNMHVHFGLKLPGAESAKLQHETDVELALRVAANARRSLLSGTTSVRSPGDRRHAAIALDAAIKRGDFIGPRIWSAGEPIAPTGGHGSAPDEEGYDGPYEVMKAVRREMRDGADWIKLMISRGIASPSGSIAASDMTLAEMRAAVDVAHRHGVKVTAHSGSPSATLEALEAGVDCFEHGYHLTEDVFRAMKREGAWYVPTIVVSQAGAMEFFEKIGSPPWYLARAKSVGEAHWKALETAIEVGVNIAMGSDQHPYEPNEGTVASVRETELYVEAGMTPVQALRAATIRAATLLGAEDDLGTLEPGKYADIVMVAADPAEDISALRTIGFVMKGGETVRNDWSD